jgi:hypothetical protein
MRVTVDEEIRTALRPLTPEERDELRGLLKRDGCTEKLPYAVIDGVPVQLDGHHRRQICTEEKLPYEWQLIESVKIKSQAIAWVKARQSGRRNLSLEELAKLREQRVERVKKAKGRGQSIRKIAKKEKVSVAQVRRDLDDEPAQERPDTSELAKVWVAQRLTELDYRPNESMFHSIDYKTLERELLSAFVAGAKSKPSKNSKGIFTPPTLEEVTAYCKERKNNVQPDVFHSHYESNGWMVGRVPMKSWKAAIVTWEKNNGSLFSGGGNNGEMFDGIKQWAAEQGDLNELHPGDKRNAKK